MGQSAALHSKPSRHNQVASALCAGRVFPTLLVLRDKESNEVWRSPELMLAEHLRASDLYDQAQKLCHMPEEHASTLATEQHDLFVYDAPNDDFLQVANMSATTLQSLQRHCEGQRLLTLVLEPMAEEDDAFEVMPGTSG